MRNHNGERDRGAYRQYYCDNLAKIGRPGALVWYVDNAGASVPYSLCDTYQEASDMTTNLNKIELEKIKNVKGPTFIL